MTFDFLLVLLVLTVFTGVAALVDMLLGKKRAKFPVIIEYCRALFPVLLIVFLIRAFIAQPFRVPTGSLLPTVVPGDFILVNQYDYGFKMPVWDKTLVKVGKPKRGQIALFYYPVNHAATFVKRVIGVPGDRISYINKVFYINGKEAKQKYIGMATDGDTMGNTWAVKIYQENLNGLKHNIYIRPNVPAHNFYNLVVPKGKYLMIGDNRDNSDDGRDWGFVPVQSFIGRAMVVLLNWDSKASKLTKKIRWHRIGTKL